MRKAFVAMLLGILFGAGASVAAETDGDRAAPACKTAEVNPVTGHVMCIDPLGAAVEAPPKGHRAALRRRSIARPVELGAELRAEGVKKNI